MKGRTDITLSIGLTVSDEMCDRALAVIEWWMNDNPDMDIVGKRYETEAGTKLMLTRVKRGCADGRIL